MDQRPHSCEILGAAHRPGVSIIAIFFNSPKYLAEAIDSVLAQTYTDWELILVDDGSTDQSTKIARRYAERSVQIHYIDHPNHQNRGMSASRNFGLAAAIGELVAFIDADDVWFPTKLAEQVAILDRYPEVAMVAGAITLLRASAANDKKFEIGSIEQTGHIQDVVIFPPKAIIKLYPLGPFYQPCPSDMMVRRSAIDDVKHFEEEFRGAGEDYAFVTKIALRFPVYFSSRSWFFYRIHSNSSTARVLTDGAGRLNLRHLLEWMDKHTRTCSNIGPRIRLAILRRLLPFRYPVLDYPRRFGKVVLPRLVRMYLRAAWQKFRVVMSCSGQVNR
jgi:glycosyltransferase involved in cell wall biosynthesis